MHCNTKRKGADYYSTATMTTTSTTTKRIVVFCAVAAFLVQIASITSATGRFQLRNSHASYEGGGETATSLPPPQQPQQQQSQRQLKTQDEHHRIIAEAASAALNDLRAKDDGSTGDHGDSDKEMLESGSKLLSLLTELESDVKSIIRGEGHSTDAHNALPAAAMAMESTKKMTPDELKSLRSVIDDLLGEPHNDAKKGGDETDDQDQCTSEYERVNSVRTRGLSDESVLRSRAWIGNSERLRNVASALDGRQRPVNAVVFGASISVGHGVFRNTTKGHESGRYSDLLEDWFNDFYPLDPEADNAKKRRHRVHNWSSHGASMCSLAKRVRLVVDELEKSLTDPDMFVLEFAVNDYQGQGDSVPADEKLDVYFDGFEDVALCAEVVVNHLLRRYPNAAITFLEMRTALLERKTAQSLHMGVAQHYEVPVISFAEAMFPEYIRLVSMLNVSESYTVPVGEELLPYPYGCSRCAKETITKQFLGYRDGCINMCEFLQTSTRSVRRPNCNAVPPGREHCHNPLFAHDNVHTSGAGHRIAKDLLAHAISSAQLDNCEKKPYAKHLLPFDGWLGTPKALHARGEGFVFVNDTKHQFAGFRKLVPTNHTPGWSLYSDVSDKLGWITTSPTGNETITFDIDLPQLPCYAVYVGVLRSYNGMGKFTVDVEDLKTGRSSSVEADGKWNAPISIWYDYQVTQDRMQNAPCTGRCRVTVRNQDQVQDRTGNKIKIMTLSARECVA